MYDVDEDVPLTYVMGDTVYAYIYDVLITADGSMLQSEIADEIEFSQAAVSRAIRGAVDVGVVVEEDDGWGYRLNSLHPATDQLVGLHMSLSH